MDSISRERVSLVYSRTIISNALHSRNPWAKKRNRLKAKEKEREREREKERPQGFPWYWLLLTSIDRDFARDPLVCANVSRRPTERERKVGTSGQTNGNRFHRSEWEAYANEPGIPVKTILSAPYAYSVPDKARRSSRDRIVEKPIVE